MASVTMTTPGGYFFNYEKKEGLFQKAGGSPGFTYCWRGESTPHIENYLPNSQKHWSYVKSDKYFSAMQLESYYVPA